jgi:hypothetical protein
MGAVVEVEHDALRALEENRAIGVESFQRAARCR